MQTSEQPQSSQGANAVPAGSDSNRTRDLLLIVVLLVLVLVPFAKRALHLDDPFYVWVAKHIAEDPLDFFGFTLNWNGLDEPVFEINKNPPGISYYLAAVGSLFGWRESNYHAALLLVTIATAIGIYLVAERLTKYPLLAVLLVIASPVFLLSATNVMAEMGMLMFYVWALYFWIRGLNEDRIVLLLLAGALAGLSTLTKYYGLSAIPLFLAYGIVVKRRIGVWVLALLVPVIILAFYELYTARLYGRGHLLSSILYSEQSDLRRHPIHIRTLIGLAFAGGCMFPIAAYTFLLWPLKKLVAMGVFVGTATALLGAFFLDHFFVVEPELGGGRFFYALQFAVLLMAGINIFLLAMGDLRLRKDAASVLLFLWFFGTFVFAVRLNWAINGRSLLAAAVPMGLYVARVLEVRGINTGRFNWRLYGPLLPATCVAILVVYADYTQANLYRSAAHSIIKNFGGSGHTVWYQGHWGFQYYMDELGAKHTKSTGMEVTDGDYLITPYYNTAMHNLHSEIVRSYWDLKIQPFPWLTSWNPQVGAGYYADSWGPMPFVVTRVPPEQFLITGINYTGTLQADDGADAISPSTLMPQ